ncbi:MAG: tetratricopeptide repeat protein [Acidobacteriota bacterium]
MSERGQLKLEVLKRERTRLKIRQADVAAALGIAERHFRRIENGEVVATEEQLEKLLAWAWSELDLPEGDLLETVVAETAQLPVVVSEFVGRRAELERLSLRLADEPRLLTLLGPPGVGKTRLVLEHGREAQVGGASVFFCDLSEVRSTEGIVGALARTLDVPLGQEPIGQLGHALAARGPCLVIFDNFEQVAEHADATLGEWLSATEQVTFVVTSRVLLHVPGEEVFPLEPLELETEAVELFELRAKARLPEFSLEAGCRDDVVQIVRLLDGLPLAIELAAARLAILSPASLLERLADRFRVLVGTGGARERQATLRAAIDWSWELLEPWEKSALAQASVFEGGFTLEAAEQVIDLEHHPGAPWVLDAVQALVDKSLLRARHVDAFERREIAEPCFGMYVSVHDYAAEKLRTPGAIPNDGSGSTVEESVFRRHLGHYARLGRVDAAGALRLEQRAATHRILLVEVSNFEAACRRSLVLGECEDSVNLLGALWAVLYLTGPAGLVHELARLVLAQEGLEAGQRARALNIRGQASVMLGEQSEARAMFDEARGLHHELGDERGEALLFLELGALCFQSSSMAGNYFRDALRLAREVGDELVAGRALFKLGRLARLRGELAEARPALERALELHEAVGDSMSKGQTLGNLAALAGQEGALEESIRLGEEALALMRKWGHSRLEGFFLGELATVYKRLGAHDAALELSHESVKAIRKVGDRAGEVVALSNLGTVYQDQERWEEAQCHQQRALELSRILEDRTAEGYALTNLGSIHLNCECPAEARECLESALAIHRELGNRRAIGHVLGVLGELFGTEGQLEEAQQAFDEGEAMLRQVGEAQLLCLLLVQKGCHEAAHGAVSVARGCLVEAEELLQSMAARPESLAARKVDDLRSALAKKQPEAK